MRTFVTCAIGGSYPFYGSQQRASVFERHKELSYISFSNMPQGCPAHLDQPYAFKIFAIREARARGFEQILWVDCRHGLVKPLDELWKIIETRGWYAPVQGDAVLGNWCSDDALKVYEFDRKTAMSIPLVWGAIMGFDFTKSIARDLFADWEGMFKAGAFKGAWVNKPHCKVEPWGSQLAGHVSSDPKVGGHRHDEAAYSAVLYYWGLKPDATLLDVFRRN
jgi:hypothetical protein